MGVSPEKRHQDLFLVHILFIALCVVVLILPGLAIGAKVFTLVVAYNLLIPVVGHLRNHRDWLPIWGFALALSIFQIFPDWFLAAELETIVFPDDGFLMIGPVSGYMAGLWAIPLFIIVYIGSEARRNKSEKWGYLIVALLSFLIFGIAEATMWMLPSWYAVGVAMVGNVAIYIIIPEILLGLSTFFCYLKIKDRPYIWRILGAFVVMIFYLGSSSFFYFLIERIIIGA